MSDVNEAVEIFTTKISQIHDVMAPIRVFRTRKKYVPWLSSDTKSLMTHRDRLLTAAKSANLKKDWDEFRKARNKVTSKLRTDK